MTRTPRHTGSRGKASAARKSARSAGANGARGKDRAAPRNTAGLAPRAAALELLGGVILQQRTLAELESDASFLALSPSDRATAGRLARNTLRLSHRADAMLKPHLSRSPSMVIQVILRMAVIEMIESGAASHGVVNAAVSLAKQQQKSSAGLVNAVLRKVAEADRTPWDKAPATRLPNWLRGRLGSAYGNARVARMEEAHSAGAPLDLTLRDPKTADRWAAELDAEILPTGSLRLRAAGQVSKLPGFEEGAWWVQDAAAALPAHILAPQPGERVLDLCAAPGGKTLQAAAAGADVTALDISEGRLARLEENLSRIGLKADVVAADALDWEPEQLFDAILLDAPCSATGTVRRHPDLPYVRTAEDVTALRDLQFELATRACDWLAPGGRLMLCTCSLLPAEGEDLLAQLLEVRPDLQADPLAEAWPSKWYAKAGGLRLTPDLWPEHGGMDGFFMALLHRTP
jgi:16S rRNA (cytosine967-C5)-methyltransferase